ncbi:hypothetical protein [Paraburkholderia fungorum]|uniref:hypothetical protein n=1 Tax=Paraburkholderia fungorum TaxID=134537 RepID=UPI003D6AAEC4
MSGADYTMTQEQARALLGTTSLPHDLRVMVLQNFVGEHGVGALADLFAQFIGLANSVVENNREMAELLLITEGGMHPGTAEKINLPTIFGALQGVKLAAGVNTSSVCHGCAFRLGSAANQSPVTSIDADDCAEPGGDNFMCHEDLDEQGQPVKGCAGFAQQRARRKREMAA